MTSQKKNKQMGATRADLYPVVVMTTMRDGKRVN